MAAIPYQLVPTAVAHCCWMATQRQYKWLACAESCSVAFRRADGTAWGLLGASLLALMLSMYGLYVPTAAVVLAAVFQGLLFIAYVVGLLVPKPEHKEGAKKSAEYMLSAPAGAPVTTVNAT